MLADLSSMETKQLELYQRNKAIPFSLLQGSTSAFPAGTASRRACSHVPGHATLMQLSPPKPWKLHVARPLWSC